MLLLDAAFLRSRLWVVVLLTHVPQTGKEQQVTARASEKHWASGTEIKHAHLIWNTTQDKDKYQFV